VYKGKEKETHETGGQWKEGGGMRKEDGGSVRRTGNKKLIACLP
jgi:hypothetical protein